MSTYISGGCKNGKSFFAQRAARAAGAPLYYVATMIPRDDEDMARVRRHRDERAGWDFQTLEQGRDILACLDEADTAGAFLIDSVTALLSNEMFCDGRFFPDAPAALAEDLCAFVRRAPKTVLVSDFIFSDALLYDDLTEAYRRGLAYIDRRMAAVCDDVIEVVCGKCIARKGVLPF